MNKKIFFYLCSLIVIIIFFLISMPIFIGFGGTVLQSLGLFFIEESKVTFTFFKNLINLPGLKKSVFLTIFVGFLSTFISLIISQIILLKVFSSNYYLLLQKLIIPLIAFPHVTMAVGVTFLFSSSGFFSRMYSVFFTGLERPPNSTLFPDDYGFFLILGLILKETPFFLLMSVNILAQFKSNLVYDLGKTLNHVSFGSWIYFIFPQLYKKLKISIIIVLIFSASVVDMSYFLAPSTPSILSIRILELYQKNDSSNIALVSCMALFQFFVIIGLIIFWHIIEIFVRKTKTLILIIFPRTKNFVENLFFTTCFFVMSTSILCIFLCVLWAFSEIWSFPNLLPTVLTFHNFFSFANNFYTSFLNTVYISGIVSFLSCFIILLWLEVSYLINFRNKYIELVFFVPLIIPELSFLVGISYVLIKNDLNGNIFSLVYVEVLYVVPYTFLILAPAFRNIKQDYIDLGKTFQKSKLNIFLFIKLPLLSKAILLSLAVGMIVSIGLYTPVYFIGEGEISTLSIEMINLSFSGNRKDLGVFTIIQMILPIFILGVIFYISKIFVKWQY